MRVPEEGIYVNDVTTKKWSGIGQNEWLPLELWTLEIIEFLVYFFRGHSSAV